MVRSALQLILDELQSQRQKVDRLERAVLKLAQEFSVLQAGLHSREQMLLFELQDIRNNLSSIDKVDLSKRLVSDTLETVGNTTEEKDTYKVSANQVITSFVIELGVPVHIKGFRYIVEALQLAITEGNVLEKPTNSLYPAIAGKYKTTPSRVERAIRHAIEVAGSRGNISAIHEMTGSRKPTNLSFLSSALQSLKECNELELTE